MSRCDLPARGLFCISWCAAGRGAHGAELRLSVGCWGASARPSAFRQVDSRVQRAETRVYLCDQASGKTLASSQKSSESLHAQHKRPHCTQTRADLSYCKLTTAKLRCGPKKRAPKALSHRLLPQGKHSATHARRRRHDPTKATMTLLDHARAQERDDAAASHEKDAKHGLLVQKKPPQYPQDLSLIHI